MKTRDRVKVYPHGSPDQAATATVLLFSANQRSIAVAFDDKPPFAVDKSGGMMLHKQLGTIESGAARDREHGAVRLGRGRRSDRP